jgi:hypothetical protein
LSSKSDNLLLGGRGGVEEQTQTTVRKLSPLGQTRFYQEGGGTQTTARRLCLVGQTNYFLDKGEGVRATIERLCLVGETTYYCTMGGGQTNARSF